MEELNDVNFKILEIPIRAIEAEYKNVLLNLKRKWNILHHLKNLKGMNKCFLKPQFKNTYSKFRETANFS